MGDAQAVAQDLASESLVGQGGHGGVEGQEIEAVDAHRGQGAGHLAGGHQAEGGGVRLEPAARMGVETDHGQGHGEAAGRSAGLGDHRLMAAMDAVEGPDGDGRAVQPVGQVAPVGDDLDQVSLSRGADGGERGPGRRRP